MNKKPEVLAIIPARSGSTRIKGKNIKNFCGKPLIAYTILQAKKHPRITRVIVDTDSEEIASIARTHGAETPFLRPKHLATKTAGVNDAIAHLLGRLKKEEGYAPDLICLLQTTSPLREPRDITECFKLFEKGGATTVLTICETNPRFFHLDKQNNLILVNKPPGGVFKTNTQDWPKGYILNGCFVYLTNTAAFLKEKTVYTKKTKAVVCEKWRSVDLDYPEDWAVAEVLYQNRRKIEARIKKFSELY